MPRDRILDYRPYYNHYQALRRRSRASRGLAAGVFAVGNHVASLFRSREARREVQQSNRSNTESSSTEPSSTMARSGSYHSTSAGRFGPTRPVRSDATYSFAKKGFCHELTRGGSITDSNCVYVGHTDFPPDRTLFIACIAMVRQLFAQVDLDFEAEQDVIPPIPGVDAIYIDWIDNTQTVNGQTFTWVVGTGTLGDVGLQLFNFFKAGLQSQARRSYRRIKLGASNTQGIAVVGLRASFNLLTATVSILNSSYLKVQNSTVNNHGGTATDDIDELADNVNSIPVKGNAYFGKGTWTGLEPYQLLGTLGSSQPTVPYEISGHPEFGLMIMRGASTSNSIPTQRPYYNPPPGKQMMRVSGCSHVTLEPGCMKSDSLVFNVSLPFNTFLYKVYVNGYMSLGNSQTTGLFSRSMMGHFKLFALEKKIHSTSDPIVLRYEMNQVIRAKVYLPKTASSMVWNEDKVQENFPNP